LCPILNRRISRNFFFHGVKNKLRGEIEILSLSKKNEIDELLIFRYKGVQINDFTRSWQDGLAFNALLHRYRPELFDYEELLQNAAARNLEHAFSIGKAVFRIDRYLDVEGLSSLLIQIIR
jgi:hypothetical protein